MSDVSRHRRYFAWLGVVLGAVMVVALLLIPPDGWIAIDQRRSSDRTTSDGVAAWSRSLEQLGVRVARRYRSLTDEPPRSGGLVMLEPVLPPTAAEVRELLAWVRQGGVLVYSPDRSGLLLDSLGLSDPGATEQPALGPRESPEQSERGSLKPHRWTEGVAAPWGTARSVEADPARARTWVPLSVGGDTVSVTMAWVPEGLGGILLVADAEALANGTLGSSPLAIVTTRAISDLLHRGDTLFFSEYHQGLDGRRGSLREAYALARESPIGRGALHVALAGALLLLLSGRRFGSPLPESESSRRSPLEHVEALGRIYQTSGSHGAVARRLVRGAVRRIGLGRQGDDQETEILRTWTSQPAIASAARTALAALESDPPDLATLTGALDDIVTEHTYRLPRP